MNVSATTFTNPPRVSLRLRRDSKFGREIVFQPKMGWTINPFAKNEVVEALIERVDKARNTQHP